MKALGELLLKTAIRAGFSSFVLGSRHGSVLAIFSQNEALTRGENGDFAEALCTVQDNLKIN